MKRPLLFIFISLLFNCSHSVNRAPTSTPIGPKEQILYIGDSISAGPLGSLIYDHLNQKVDDPSSLNLYGVVSSSPRHWSQQKKSTNGKWLCRQKGRKNNVYPVKISKDICPKKRRNSSLEHLIENQKPTLVIFQFLGNSMGMSESSIKRNISNLIDQAPAAKCIFITSPPYHQSINTQNEKRLKTAQLFLEAINSRCEIFNGMAPERLEGFRNNLDYYASDKKHLSKRGASVFFDELKELL